KAKHNKGAHHAKQEAIERRFNDARCCVSDFGNEADHHPDDKKLLAAFDSLIPLHFHARTAVVTRLFRIILWRAGATASGCRCAAMLPPPASARTLAQRRGICMSSIPQPTQPTQTGNFGFAADQHFRLESGGSLRPVTLHYAVYGDLAASRDNVIL